MILAGWAVLDAARVLATEASGGQIWYERHCAAAMAAAAAIAGDLQDQARDVTPAGEPTGR